MCGIATILLYPQERPPEVWEVIRETITQNLLFNEQRGGAATGLAIFQQDGRVTMEKQAIPAHQFVKSDKYASLLEQIGPQTTLLLGHTRRPTKGSPANNQNNHPLQVGSMFGVHNGHIDNDDDLFIRLDLARQAEVDSEIIFQLLAPCHPPTSDGQYLAAIRPRLQWLQGKFTFLACDRRAPEKLLVVRHQNPISLHFHPEWNALIFSSRYIFLRKFFGQAVLHEGLPHNQLLLFEAGQLSRLGHRPVNQLPLKEEG